MNRRKFLKGIWRGALSAGYVSAFGIPEIHADEGLDSVPIYESDFGVLRRPAEGENVAIYRTDFGDIHVLNNRLMQA